MNTFTLEGTSLDAQNNPAYVGDYMVIRVTSVGTDTEDQAAYPRKPISAVIDSNGDWSTAGLWVNGDSGIESFYEIRDPSGQRETFVFPTAVEGTTVRYEYALENYLSEDAAAQLSPALAAHIADLNNPHQVTAAQVGLGTSDDVTFGIVNGTVRLETPQVLAVNSDGLILSNYQGYPAMTIGEGGSSTKTVMDELELSTDLAITEGGTGASTAAAAKVNLGLDAALDDVQTIITDTDASVPTSGAVVDYVAAAGVGSGGKHGFVDYNDTTGQIALAADTWTDVPNDGAGAFTNTTYKPSGVTSLIDVSTGYLDFDDLTLGSEILIRNDFTVVPQTNNAQLEARYLLGTGAGEYQLLFWSERLDSGSGEDYQRVTNFPIYMGDSNTKDNPGKLQVRLSSGGTMTNAGSYISIRVH